MREGEGLPRTGRSPGLVAVLTTALLLPAGGPRAEDSNVRPYLVGARAAGMGGAFTALADDGSGPYYNPAGIGFVTRSQLSLAGSLYGVASGSISSALGDGHDFHYSNLQTFPTATAGVFKLGDDDPERASVLALHVYVPDALLIDGRDRLASQENAVFLSSQSQTVWAGMTYARRWGRVSVGISGFFLFATESSQLDLSGQLRITDPTQLAQLGCPDYVACATVFATVTGRTDATTYGVVGALGVRWDPTDHLRLGLSVYSPEVGFGTRRSFARVVVPASATTPLHVRVVNDDDLHASPTLPLRVQAGLAWTSGRFTLAVDGMYLAPRDVLDDPGKADQGLDRHIVRNAVLNGAIGVEYVLADRFPLRTGFFTDFSSSAGNALNSEKIDRLGGSLSIGLRTEHTRTDAGVIVSGGTGTDVIPDNLDFSRLKQTTSSQLFTYIFLGTAYEF